MNGFVERLKGSVPWYAKILGKILLSRLPVPYRVWSRLALFRHGTMDDPEVAYVVLKIAMEAAGLPDRLDGVSVLEVGPGDALTTAMVAHGLGVRATTLLDVGAFASKSLDDYLPMIGTLTAKGLDLSDLRGVGSTEELLSRCRARYLTEGLASAQALEPNSADLVFSRAVLEHVARAEFLPLARALWRAMASDGVAFHRIDLRDHLSFGLNNLRFSESVWESPLMAKSGFYTNRIRFREMLALFRQAGFTVDVPRIARFPSLPIERSDLHPDFRDLPEEDLTVADFDVVLRKQHA